MQSIRHTNGSQARVESHKVISVVSSDVDILQKGRRVKYS